MSCVILSLLVLSCPVLLGEVGPCFVLFSLVLSCLVSSCLVLSGLVLSCLVLAVIQLSPNSFVPETGNEVVSSLLQGAALPTRNYGYRDRKHTEKGHEEML